MSIENDFIGFGELLRSERHKQGKTQEYLAAVSGYSPSYIRKLESGQRGPTLEVAEKLAHWLSLNEQDHTRLIRAAVAQASQSRVVPLQDWGEAPSRENFFYGRQQEKDQVERWIRTGSRMVAVLGFGGIGKTTFAAQFAEQIKHRFEDLFWRSLYNVPPLESILEPCLLFLSDQQHVDLPHTVDQQIVLLLSCLRKKRCLLVFDNVDALMADDLSYLEGYSHYGRFFQQLAEADHQSFILLTSRIKPREITYLSGRNASVHAIQLPGLSNREGKQLLEDKGVFGTEEGYASLVRQYSGNPLALQMISEPIREMFGGDIANFLQAGTAVFGEITTLLGQQLQTLSENERTILYWLAIEREATTLDTLREKVIAPLGKNTALLEAIGGLLRRSLIEQRGNGLFSLQPVVLEYVTNEFVTHVCDDILLERPKFLASHALILAQAKDYIRESQIRLLLTPVLQQLLMKMGKVALETKCKKMLSTLRQETLLSPYYYTAGNILNLLVRLGSDLQGWDFSHLAVWQADLREALLHSVNFAFADLKGTTFTYPFDAIIALALHPSGKQIATATTTNQIQVWDSNGTPLFACPHQDWIYAVAFSPDGKLLASGCDDQMIRLWNARTGQLLITLQGHTDRVRSLAFSPDGKLLASGGHDRTIRLWDVYRGLQLNTLSLSSSGVVWSVVFSPDGSLLASSSSDQMIRLWHAETGKLLSTLQEQSAWPIPLAFSPDGRLLASGKSDRTIHFWDVQTGELLSRLQEHTGWVMSLAFSPDGKMLASGSSDQTIHLWNVQTGHSLKMLRGHSRRVWAVCFSPNGDMLVSGSDDQTLRSWEVQTGQLLRTVHGRSNATVSVAFSPDGKMLASSCDEPSVWLWDTEGRYPLTTLRGHNCGINWSVAFSPDGSLLASGGDDHTVRLWNVQTKQLLHTFDEHRSYVWSVAFSPDGKMLASGGDDHMIRLWNVQTKQLLHTFPGQSCWVWGVTFSPDGKMLASGSDDHTIHCWDTKDGHLLMTIEGHTNWVRAVAFSPDGEMLASGGDDHTARLWDARTGQLLHALPTHSIIRSVAFRPDGKMLASGNDDGKIWLWQVETGVQLSSLQGHTHRVWGVTFSPNGKTLASGSHDGTIKIWSAETYECIETVINRPYEQMNIFAASHLTENQSIMLKELGAVEREVN